ncbi:MAG TPA: gamma carbonic anhydrase family protein [Prolixibacteraceae bacterium]|nr:gamma carbonic anhydrase family protein [Prolixibacteraceae bacterium]
MAHIIPLANKTPRIGEHCFLAPTATLIGAVELGTGCSVWFNAVLRGDVHYIKIGNHVNIQDNVVIHGTYQKSPTNIGDHVSIAHGAIVHGCTLHDHVLVGMNAVILDDAVVESNSIIAAGAVVTKGTVVPSGSVFAGAPAKKIKEISPELLKGEVERIAQNYSKYASWYKGKEEND